MRISISLAAIVVVATAKAGSFSEEQFQVVNPLDSTVLNGTLLLPEGASPKALLVLATGSGLQDRDETLGRHKPFKEIAEYLARNGYAVARTDDRGYGERIDTALVERSTQWDELADYRAVMENMREHMKESHLPVGLLGHSLGGSEAIMSFSKSPKAARYNAVGKTPDFIVTLAAPIVAGDALILDQTKQLLRLQGAEFMYTQLEPVLTQRYQWAKSFMPEKALRNALLEDIKKTLPPGVPVSEEMQKTIDSQINVFCSPGYRELLRYDPSDDIREVDVPWLALYGTKDVQVSSPLNSEALKRLTEDKNNVTVSVLEDKNHLFQDARTGALEEYQTIGYAIADDVLQEILEWLELNFNNK